MTAWRDRGLGIPVTPEVLTRAGVPESISPRTLSSLKLLALVDENGKPTEQWEAMKTARGEDEYKARLQEWLRSTYAEVLQYADPSTDSLDRVTEAFRSYQPAGQRKSMAALLIGLWAYAGLPIAANDSGSAPPRNPRRVTAPPRPQPRTRSTPPVPASTGLPAGLPPGLVGLLQQIPTAGRGWTQETRDNFLKAFSAVLDFTVPIRPVGLEDLSDSDLRGDAEEASP